MCGMSPAFDASELHASARTPCTSTLRVISGSLFEFVDCCGERRSRLKTLRAPGAASHAWAVGGAP